MDTNYQEINRKLWNDKVPYHLDSDMYDMPAFLAGNTSLKPIELELLGEVSGETLLHLQCHFGQDTLSLSRMGAQTTGVDLSDQAIAKAKELNEKLGLDANFVCCDVFEAPKHIDQQFDRVFTSYGTIGWLPDINRWAEVVAHFLRPGGTFLIVEFHPVIWMFDDEFKEVAYRYFGGDPIVEVSEGTYADRDANIANKSISWNHSMSDVIQSLLNQGLQLQQVAEYDYSPYACFLNVREEEPGKFRIAHMGDKLPMVYALKATKPV